MVWLSGFRIGDRDARGKSRVGRVVPRLWTPRMGPQLVGGERSLGTTRRVQTCSREFGGCPIAQRLMRSAVVVSVFTPGIPTFPALAGRPAHRHDEGRFLDGPAAGHGLFSSPQLPDDLFEMRNGQSFRRPRPGTGMSPLRSGSGCEMVWAFVVPEGQRPGTIPAWANGPGCAIARFQKG